MSFTTGSTIPATFSQHSFAAFPLTGNIRWIISDDDNRTLTGSVDIEPDDSDAVIIKLFTAGSNKDSQSNINFKGDLDTMANMFSKIMGELFRLKATGGKQ